MVDKIHYYLKNEDERKRIALAGQKKVFNNYTYKNQMGKIFNWVNEQKLPSKENGSFLRTYR
jgi:spore maturation protein CgeB